MPAKVKKLLIGVAALGALGLGGAALASAGTEGNNGHDTREQSATGPAADRAKQAALQSVGSGTVADVSAGGEHGDTSEKPDPSEKPGPGEPAPPAYQAQIAWQVEVTKADGSTVVVDLDPDLKVLGTQNAHHPGD